MRAKLVIALLLATVPILALVGYVGLETTSNSLRTQAESTLREAVAAQGRLMRETLSRAAADARYLAQSDEAAGFASAVAARREPSSAVTARLLAEFRALGGATGLYRRLRYLDARGSERALLDLAAPPGQQAAAGRIADLSDAEEFRSAAALRPGQVYVSPLELERDARGVPDPRRPVVRYATPVFLQGRSAGVVLLDAVPRHLVAAPLPPDARLFVADSEGWYCGHTDRRRAWSGPRNLGTGHNLRSDYGHAAHLLARPGGAVVRFADRLVATSRVSLGGAESGRYLLVGLEIPQAVALAGVDAFRRFFWIVLTIGFVAPVGAGLILGAFFLRPLRRLQKGLHSVAAGDLDAKVDIRSGDELQQLAEDFGVMLSRLRELRQQERVAVVGHLAGDISHDIKNLLTPLYGCAETLALLSRDTFSQLDALVDDAAVPDETKQRVTLAVSELRLFFPDAIEMMLDSSLAIQDRVREIADYVKGVTADAVLEPTQVDEVAERALKPLMIVARRQGVSLELLCAGPIPDVPADQRLLFTAIYNLANNAIAETPSGGSVTVRLAVAPVGSAAEAASLVIEVADTGKGMPEDVRASLFTANAKSTKAGGTGLGTRIVKNAVDAHGGTISVASEPGKGSTFTIRIPLGRRGSPPGHPSPSS